MPRTCGIVLVLLLTVAGAGRGDDPRKVIDWARTTYKVDIITEGIDYPQRRPGYAIGGEEPPDDAVAAYLSLLRRELAAYPPDLLSRMKVRRIILARNLTVDGQARSAVPDYVTMNLFIDVERGQQHPFYQRRVFHHEFFHLVDYALHGPYLADRDWARLNGDGFSYGQGGKFMQDSSRNAHAAARDIPGFLSLYGTSAVEEDKAELFSFLMTDGVFVNERAAHDAVVRTKVAVLKELLKDFCPEMDGSYWKRLGRYQAASFALMAARFSFSATMSPCLPAPLAMPVPAFVTRD